MRLTRRSVLVSTLLAPGRTLSGGEQFSNWRLVRTLRLAADTHHVQGLAVDPPRVWVSAVDREKRRGWLFEFSLTTGELWRNLDITDGRRYHPGGISSREDSMWVPVAEYRRDGSSVIERRSKRTLRIEHRFPVPDHIGALAAAPGRLVGANWDAKQFYIWGPDGELIRLCEIPLPPPIRT